MGDILISLMWSMLCSCLREKRYNLFLLLSLSATTGHASNCSVLWCVIVWSNSNSDEGWQSHKFLSVSFYKCQPVTQWRICCKILRPVHFPSSLFSWFQIHFLLPMEIKIRNLRATVSLVFLVCRELLKINSYGIQQLYREIHSIFLVICVSYN